MTAPKIKCVTFACHPDKGIVQFCLRVPNPLEITKVEHCPFYEEFMEFCGQKVSKKMFYELEGLKKRIEEFVETEKLYCNFNPREPMIYIARW